MYEVRGKQNLADHVAIYGRGRERFRPPTYIDVVFNRNTRYSAFPVRSATFAFLPLYLCIHSFLFIVEFSPWRPVIFP
jgi:hypothetical protein